MKISIAEAMAEGPDRVALVSLEGSWTYAELANKVARRAQALPTVPWRAVAAHRTPDAVIEMLACVEAGIPFVPTNPKLTSDRQPLPATPLSFDERILALVPTSGTTGQPKLVALSHRAFIASAQMNAANLGARDDDRWLLCMPLWHVGGLSILSRAVLARACVVLAPEGSFDAQTVLSMCEEHRVTLLSVVPTMLERLLDASRDQPPPSAVRAVLVGGAHVPDVVLDRADRAGWPVLTTYGLTEACSQVVTQIPGEPRRGVGKPLPGVQVRIRDGVIDVCGPSLMSGYVPGDAQPFLDDGWFPTGDVGKLDDAGYLHVLGRKDDRIITGGENVDPVAVENELLRCPGVTAACVFGIPDTHFGQRIAAALVGNYDDATLANHIQTRLAPHERPRSITRVNSLPCRANGKLDRGVFRSESVVRP